MKFLKRESSSYFQLTNRLYSQTDIDNSVAENLECIFTDKHYDKKGSVCRLLQGSLSIPSAGEVKVKVPVVQSRPTLCNPVDSSLPGPSVHGTPQARILEWVAIPFSRGPSQPRDQILSSAWQAGFLP